VETGFPRRVKLSRRYHDPGTGAPGIGEPVCIDSRADAGFPAVTERPLRLFGAAIDLAPG